MTSSTPGFVRDRNDYQWLSPFPGEQVAVHVDGRQTGGKFYCAEAMIEPGVGQPRHIHHNLDELLYVLEGEIDFVLGDRRFRGTPGAVVFVPQGSVHAFHNFGARAARMLGVLSPTGMDGFFEAMEGQPASAFPEIARRHGIEIVGPMIEPETA